MTPQPQAPVRNVVLFVADDLGWGDLGIHGSVRIPTPRLDALAAGGISYSDCHASSSVCTPSRYSLLTGEYPWRSPLGPGVLGGTDPSIIRDGQETLGTVARRHGRTAGAFGKWHLGLDWQRKDGTVASAFSDGFAPRMQADGFDVDYTMPFTSGPLDHGFDRFFGIAGSLDMPPYCFLDQDHAVGLPVVPKPDLITSQRPGPAVDGWKDDQVDVEVTRAACAWIRECAAADAPFLAYVASAAPHRPCVPPAFVKGLSGAGARGDAVCLVDWMVGEILDTLDACGIREDTVVIFTSDNGAPLIFPEDGDTVVHRPNGPWRGQKADVWEGGHRVPLIIQGPGVAPSTMDDPVSLLDVHPTLERLFGSGAAAERGEDAPRPDHRDGRLLVGVGGGAVNAQEPRLFGQQSYDGSLVLREGRDKAIFSTGSGGFSEPVGVPTSSVDEGGQFFTLDSDPRETCDLWQGRHDEAARMLRDFTAQTGYPRRGAAQ